jgi:hypothetical protein
VSREIARINKHLLSTKCGVRKRAVFLLNDVFQKVYDEGYSPSSPCELDDQGLPGLGRASGVGSAGLGVSRRIVPSYKDWFVILHYLYS